MITKISQVQTTDRELNQVQQNVVRAVNPVLQNPLVNGILLEDVVLATGDNTVNHRLNRELIGWFITRRNGASAVYDKQATNPLPDKTLILNAAGAVTVSLYVF